MAEEEVSGIALGLSLDTTGWSSGIAKAKAEVGGLKAELRQLGVTGRVQIARQQAAQLAGPNAISAQFTASKGAVRDLRVAVNEHFRVMAQTGEAITVPVKLGRVPYATIRAEIQRGIGEVPITIKLGAISGGQGALAALISQQTGITMGRAQQTIESAAAAKGIPRRAMGGPIATRALVGERGPEILEMRGGGGYISRMVGGGQVDPFQRLMSAAGRLQPHHTEGGRAWYRQAGAYGRSIAASRHMPEDMALGVLAALSAGTSWESNKTKFERIADDYQRGKPFRYGLGLDAHRKALAILKGAKPAEVFASSPKVSQFHRGLEGDLNALVFDRWATRTSLGRDTPPTRGPARARLESAWLKAAASSGLAPAEFQAALWLQEKEESGQAPGQIGLGLARGGAVSPGQKEMFFNEPKPGYCSRCRVSYTAGGKSRHYLSDSHADIAAGRRSPSGMALYRSTMGKARPRYFDYSRRPFDEGTDEENAAAARRLGVEGYARGGFAGGISDLRRLKAVYNKSVGLPVPQEGFYHEIDPDFSRRTAAAYEGLRGGSSRTDVAAYRAFAAETEAQYRLLRSAGYTFSPSRTDPYAPVGGLTKMQLAGQDALRNKHLSAFASALDHPLLSKRENWIFRGVHDMFGHLAEGFSVGPRGEFNAAASHSQMYSPLAQLAMLAETHGQNSVVNFSPTVLPGYGGRSIAEVNAGAPGTIYADQKARRLPQNIVDEFNRRIGRRAGGGEVRPLIGPDYYKYVFENSQAGKLRMSDRRSKTHIFHGTNARYLASILEQGIVTKPPQRQGLLDAPYNPSDVSYWAGSPFWASIQSGVSAMLRTPRTLEEQFSKSNELRRRSTVSPDALDILSTGGKWRPLTSFKPEDFGRAQGGPIDPKSITELLGETLPLATRGGGRSSAAHYATMAPLGYDYKIGRGYYTDNWWDPEGARNPLTMTELMFGRNRSGRNEKGGDVPPGTYIVNEVGRELFVPKDKEAVIPPDVAAQIPGGGSLLERMKAREASQTEPWKPAWMRRGMAKDLTRRSSGGIAEIDGPGPRVWQAPGDGWIIPNRLMNKIPRAAAGASFGGGGFEEGMRAEEQRRQEAAYEARYQAEARAKRVRDRLIQLTPTQYGNEGALEELRRVRALSIPAGGRTPPTLLGAATGFLATGERKAIAVEQYREASRGLLELRKQIGPNIFGELDAQVRSSKISLGELAKTHRKNSDEVREGIKTYRDSLALREHARDLDKQQAEALPHISTGVADVSRSFLALQGTFALYQVGLTAVNKALEIGAQVAAPFVDRFNGFTAVASQVAGQLAKDTKELGGNVRGAIAGQALQAGVGGAGLQYLTGALTAPTLGRAAAQAAGSQRDLFLAALSFSQGKGATGLFGGYGGILGSSVLGEQLGGGLGFGETFGKTVGDLRTSQVNALSPTRGRGFGPVKSSGPNAQSVAAYQTLTSYIGNFNDEISRGARYLGQADTGLRQFTREQFDAANGLADYTTATGKAKDAEDAAWKAITEQATAAAAQTGNSDALSQAQDEAKNGVVLLDKSARKVASSGQDIVTAYTQAAQGAVLPSAPAYAQQQAQDLLAQFRVRGAQGEFERQTQIPGQFALQTLAEPFQRAQTGFALLPGEANKAGANGQTIQQQLDQTQKLQDQLSSQTDDGLNKLRKLISDNIDAVTPLTELPAGGALGQFNAAVSTIQQYGAAIQGLNADIADQQAIQATAQYRNNIRLLNRSLKDAQALQKPPSGNQLTVGADNLGALQRAEFDIGRQSQLLSFALSQRQINFQTAVAGFQAPGITGQERAARIQEAQIEASFAQKQLNLQRQQFSLEGTAFIVQAKRAEVDVQASIDLEKAARDAQNRILADQKAISGDQAALARAQAQANSLISQASDNYGATLSVTGKYLGVFDQSVLSAANDIRTAVLGLPALQYNPKTGGFVPHQVPPGSREGGIFPFGAIKAQAGWNGSVGRTTAFVAGEAGADEHVVVMRNPKYGQMASAGVMGGGAGASVAVGPIYVTGNTINDDRDLEKIASRLADMVEEKLGTKAKLLGVSTF